MALLFYTNFQSFYDRNERKVNILNTHSSISGVLIGLRHIQVSSGNAVQ